MQTFTQKLQAALTEPNPATKCALTNELYKAWNEGQISFSPEQNAQIQPFTVGRPAKPNLVHPRELHNRKITTPIGHASLIHSLAHIEFNAINLALDACYRFRDMPKQYYSDWLKVAYEEAYHYSLLQAHLKTLGYKYGDFNSHNGLWSMAEQTGYDVLVRMALVPRLMEARGLDVAPGIMNKLAGIGDTKGADILKIIMHDEEGHVVIGNHWYNTLCKQRGVNALNTFMELVAKFAPSFLRGPYELDARRRAGFTEEELAFLTD